MTVTSPKRGLLAARFATLSLDRFKLLLAAGATGCGHAPRGGSSCNQTRGRKSRSPPKAKQTALHSVLEESGRTRIRLIADRSDYYVVLNERRTHWSEYQTNL